MVLMVLLARKNETAASACKRQAAAAVRGPDFSFNVTSLRDMSLR
jgi:hypothetical protein